MPHLNTQNRTRSTRELSWLLLAGGCLAACAPGTGPGARRAEASDARAKAAAQPPVEAELRAAAPPQTPAGAAGANALALQVPPPPPPPDTVLECVNPPDPELDKESLWSRQLGHKLDREFPSLRRCTADLPEGEEGSITLRLVYQKDGSPLSQHVVTSTPNACAIHECIERELADVRAPTLLIDKASIDLTLSLARGAVPQRLSDPVDPLAPDEAQHGEGCVDPQLARLSHSKVREIVSTSYDGLEACYGRALTRNHSAAGKVSFEFIIGQDGRVSEAWAREATLYDCEAITCMLAEFRALEFPEPVGRSVRVIYPINYVIEQQPVTLR